MSKRDSPMPPKAELERLYEQALDSMLTPTAVKENLIKTQSLEKKWQTVQLQQSTMVDSSYAKSMGFGVKGKQLMSALASVSTPDIPQLLELKSMLKTANKAWMEDFLDYDGIGTIVAKMSNLVARVPLSELDASLLYELVLCCKAIMNNSTGMDNFLGTPGAIDVIARSLCFDWKVLALEALEILSVCCYYSSEGTSLTISGLRHFSRSRQEAPFTSIITAIKEEDVELRSAILLLINYMVSGVHEAQLRVLLRKELEAARFSDVCLESISEAKKETEGGADVRKGIRRDNNGGDVTMNPDLATGRQRASVSVASAGRRKFQESLRESTAGSGSSVASVGSNGETMLAADNESIIDPAKGIMSGHCLAAKNRGHSAMKITDMFGNKRIKNRWYSLDNEVFQWYEFHNPIVENDPTTKASKNRFHKGSCQVSQIVDIKPISSDPIVVKETPHSFDIITEERIFSLGCTSSVQKELWLTALQSVKSNSTMKKSAYKMATKELGPDDTAHFLQQFVDQFAAFESLMSDDREARITASGVDTTDALQMCKLLSLELTANGLSSRFIALLQELLVFPCESRTAEKQWDILLSACKKLRSIDNIEAAQCQTTWGFTSDETLVDLCNLKENISREGGSYYKEINKVLRLLAEREAEVENLKEKLVIVEKNATTSPDYIPPPPPMLPKKPKKQKPQVVDDAKPSTMPHPAPPLIPTMPPPPPIPTETYTNIPPQIPPPAIAEVSLTSAPVPTQLPISAPLPTSVPAPVSVPVPTLVPAPAAAISAPAPAPAPAPAATGDPDPRYEKYTKMRKMLPEGAVRQKMMGDGFSPDEIESFIANGAPMVAGAAAATSDPDPRYEKYTKMRKMLPEGAVRQKMMGDGFSPDEIESFFSGGAPAAAGGGGGGGGPIQIPSNPLAGLKKAGNGGTGGVGVGGGGFARAATAVTVVVPVPTGMKEKAKVVPPVKMKSLFWTKLKPEEVQDTIWVKAGNDETTFEQDELEFLEAQFGNAPAKAIVAPVAASDKPKAVSMVDGKKTQNILISMGKLRKDADEITDMAIGLDPKSLTQENTGTLLGILPSPEEISAITSYDKPEDLDKADKLYLQLAKIPRLEQRLRCHEIAFRWNTDADVASASLNVMIAANKEITNPECEKAFSKVLTCVLSVGNYLNGGSARGQAYGVKLDVLVKICTIKASSSKMGSLLNFVAKAVMNKYPEAAKYMQSWISMWAAAEVPFKQLETDIKTLSSEVDRCQNELTNQVPKMVTEKPDIGKPLENRLKLFLSVAAPRMQELKIKFSQTTDSIKETMAKYGETVKNGEGDSIKDFFILITTFTKSFQTVIEDLENERKEQKRKENAQPDQRNNSSSSGKDSGSNVNDNKPKENIFGNFHANKGGSQGDMIAEFKRRMQQKNK